MVNGLGNRFKKLIKSKGFSNKSFAQECNVSANYISILIKKNNIPDSFKFNITKVIPDANINWLETGICKMLLNQDEKEIKFVKGLDDFSPNQIMVYIINNHDKFKDNDTYQLFIKSLMGNSEVEKYIDAKINKAINKLKKQ